MTLAKRTGGIFYTTLGLKLWVSGAYTAPLAQLLQLVERVLPCKGKHGIEHGRHVTRIEEKAVAGKPCRIIGVCNKELRVKDVDKVGTAHCTAGMSGLGLFDHRSGKNTDGVGRTINCFIHYACVLSLKI